MTVKRFSGVVALLGIAGLGASMASAAITIPTVPIGNPGNAADPLTGYGSVGYGYNIGTTEVTNAQYAAFLNAVARTDTNNLYNSGMGGGFGGIQRIGSPGVYTYEAVSGRASNPVNFVSFWDAARFANWLTNGQPTGPQNASTTEDGAYTLTPNGITNNTVTRKVFKAGELQWRVTSEDEWYKAAYHQPASAGGDSDNYWLYPTQSNAAPTTARANFSNAIGNTTPVGSYAANFYGAFDMGGNVWEWTEEARFGSTRGLRGGEFVLGVNGLRADNPGVGNPSNEDSNIGFRVSQGPGPSAVALVAVGGVMAGRRRRQFGTDRRARSTTTRARVVEAAAVVACSAASALAQPTLTFIPSNSIDVTGDVAVYGLSHNGQVVWGRDASTGGEWYWSAVAGKQYGVPRPSGAGFGRLQSYDGTATTGFTFEGRPNTPLPVYRRTGQPEQVLAVSAPDVCGWAEAVSSQGGVVVGSSNRRDFGASGFNPYEQFDGAPQVFGSSTAFRWTRTGAYQSLTYDTRSWSAAFAASADGSVVVGAAHNRDSFQIVDSRAVRWDVDGTGMAVSPAGTLARAYCVSADGNVVSGLVYDSVASLNAGAARAVFRWTVDAGYEVIDSRSNGLLPYGLLGMSADGSAIATALGLWRADTGYIDYYELFVQANPPAGVGLVDYYVSGFSDDGNRLAGLAYESGTTERWRPFVLTIPAPSAAALLGLGGVVIVRRRR